MGAWHCVCKREYVGLIFAPLAVTAFLSLVVTLVWHDDIPRSLDSHEWAIFIHKIELTLAGEDTARDLLLLLVFMHALQTLFCFPLLHITKILYGYLLGTWPGCALATVWEMVLVTAFVLYCARLQPGPPTPPLRKLLEHTQALRDSGTFYIFTMCVQLASIPLVTATALVLYRIMTPVEFLSSHLLVTFVMSFKDAWLGDFIKNSDGQPLHVIVMSVIFFVSTILPTVVTVLLLGQVSKASLEMLKAKTAESAGWEPSAPLKSISECASECNSECASECVSACASEAADCVSTVDGDEDSSNESKPAHTKTVTA